MQAYIKISPYIVYLQIDDKDIIRDLLNDDTNINSPIIVKRCKVIKIEHIATKDTIKEIKRKMLNKSIQIFIENCWFEKNIYVFQTYERAFFDRFMKLQEYNLFENGYCGPCNTFYENGQIEYEGNINNGQAYGLCRKYFKSGRIESEGTLINNKRNGEFKVYIEKPNGEYKLKVHRDYVDGIIVKKYLLES